MQRTALRAAADAERLGGQEQGVDVLIATIWRIVWAYYRPRSFARHLYERLGVRFLSRYCPNGGSRFSITKSFIGRRQPRSRVLRGFLITTVIIETGHLLAATALLWFMVGDLPVRRMEAGIVWSRSSDA